MLPAWECRGFRWPCLQLLTMTTALWMQLGKGGASTRGLERKFHNSQLREADARRGYLAKNMLLTIVVFTEGRGMVSAPEIAMEVGKSLLGNASVNKEDQTVWWQTAGAGTPS